jgi:hypothetical protein
MSYKTLAKDIADDIRSDMEKGIIEGREGMDRAISESAEGSEVSFKPLAAKNYLAENNVIATGQNVLFAACKHLTNRIYLELDDLW